MLATLEQALTSIRAYLAAKVRPRPCDHLLTAILDPFISICPAGQDDGGGTLTPPHTHTHDPQVVLYDNRELLVDGIYIPNAVR